MTAHGSGGVEEEVVLLLPTAVLEVARQAVTEGRSSSLAAYFTEITQQAEGADELKSLLDDLDEQYDKPTADDYAWARAVVNRAKSSAHAHNVHS